MTSQGPASLDWEPVVQGDTMAPVHLLFEDDGVPLAVHTAAMHVRDARGRLVLDWSADADASALTVVDSAGGHVQVGPITVELAPDTYFYDIEAQTAVYGLRTWFRGVFPVEVRL